MPDQSLFHNWGLDVLVLRCPFQLQLFIKAGKVVHDAHCVFGIKTWIRPSRRWLAQLDADPININLVSNPKYGLVSTLFARGRVTSYETKQSYFWSPSSGWDIVFKFVGVTWPQIQPWFRSGPGVLCGDYLPLAGLPPRQHAHCPLDMSARSKQTFCPSQIRDNGWDSIRFFREAILENLLLLTIGFELHLSFCVTRWKQRCARNVEWLKSSRVGSSNLHVASSCFELPHSDMSIATR